MRLLAALGNPQELLPPVVHIAGTNGKGSTLAFLRAFLEAAGYRVHCYISPHLVHFNERIRLAGRLIDEPSLSAILVECESANAGSPITFFEITTAAAFLAFARTPADVVLLEIGLGGRFDATNVVPHPACTIVTPVSLDHQHFLGETVAKIAFEKAGIFKPSVAAVLGPQSAEATEVLERRAREIGAPLFRCGREWTVSAAADGGLLYRGRRTLALPPPGLLGRHQYDNAGTALAALDCLAGFTASEATLARGITAVDWPARLQRLRRGPLAAALPPDTELWLDGAHNAAGGAALAEVAAAWRGRPLALVFAMLGTHDARAFLKPLAALVSGVDAVAIPGEANTLPAEAAAAAAADLDIAAAAHATIADAVAAAGGRAPRGRVLICGSLYLAGRVLAENW
jgi:dihydrofolate synthase/folylpolyglutamate synthase